MTRNILKSSLENASFRIVFQVLFRCVTFVLNAWILRRVGADALGIMNVRLLLFESTAMFLSQEPCIKACQMNTRSLHWPQVINQIWLTVPACAIICTPLLYVWLYMLSSTNNDLMYQYEIACYIMAASCIVDQTANCPMLIATTYCFIKLKVVLETLHFILRTIIFVFLIVRNVDQAIYAFAIAQITSSIFFVAMIYGFFWWYIKRINQLRLSGPILKTERKTIFTDMDDFKFTSLSEFFPGVLENNDHIFNKKLSLLTVSFVKQCVVKHVLTEGERYVMTISPVMSFREQATYDVVNNLGSMAARFIFRPIEESGYFYFTQMIRRDEPIIQQDKKNVAECAQVLSQFCSVVTSIGLIALTFGQGYSSTLLYLYGGDALTSSSLPTLLLRCHCFAILLLAINGVTECYVFATMSNKQLDRYNYVMVFFSVTFLIISYIFTYVLGPVGFIFANCINMLARISHSLFYISKQYQTTQYRPLTGLRPKNKFFTVLIVSGLIVKWSESFASSIIIHISIGVFCLIITVLTWTYENKELLISGIERYRRKSIIKID